MSFCGVWFSECEGGEPQLCAPGGRQVLPQWGEAAPHPAGWAGSSPHRHSAPHLVVPYSFFFSLTHAELEFCPVAFVYYEGYF